MRDASSTTRDATMWNATFLPHLLLFMGFLIATFNGLIAIKTKTIGLFDRAQSGPGAVAAGYGLVAFGLLCLAGLIVLVLIPIVA